MSVYGRANTSTSAHDRSDDEVDARAQAIADEFGATVEQASRALRHLVEALPSLSRERHGSPGSSCVDYADQFLRGACSELPWERSFALITQTPTDLLESRVLATEYLSGAHKELPLYNREDLADQLQEFREFLIGDRSHLLATGLPSRDFPGCRWLWSKLAKLYPTKRAENGLPFVEPIECGGVPSHYRWVRAVPENPERPVIGIAFAPCQQHEADFIANLTPADAGYLVDLRERILDVKVAVLAEAAQFLRSPDQDDLWGRCVSHFKNAPITADDAKFLISMDRIYVEPPREWKTVHPRIAQLLGYDGPCEPGGVTALFELIGHVQKEQTIGTMHKTREALGDLVIVEEGRPRLGDAVGPWSYFRIIGERDQTLIDRAIDIFRECDDREHYFWQQFQGRIVAAIENELACRIPGSFAHRLQLTMQTFRNSQRGPNVFRWRGERWEIQFKDGQLNVYEHLDGLLYLSRMVQRQGRRFLPSDLRAAKAQFVGGADSRSAVEADNICADRSDSSTDAGELIDPQAREEYRQRVEELNEQLEDAHLLNEETRIIQLEGEKERIIEALRAATGLGGRTTRISRDAKNTRDAVKNAINRAVEHIGRKDEALETHFSNSLDFQDLFTYRPESMIAWIDH